VKLTNPRCSRTLNSYYHLQEEAELELRPSVELQLTSVDRGYLFLPSVVGRCACA
jgi:hypothetical protein